MSQFDLIRRIHVLEARVKALEEASKSDEDKRAVLAEKYKEKFGRMPHHFMKTETILEAINGG